MVDVKKLRWKTPAAVVGIGLLSALLTYVLRPTGQNIGDYRYSPFASDASDAVWSRDGKAVAYQGEVNGVDQVFMRSLKKMGRSFTELNMVRAKPRLSRLIWRRSRRKSSRSWE